ncbi:Retrovirus-related Pol polyprotein from transposon RE2 [Vitis vinifera]|uniref:Retrovirus-related Pol polyprotein from transposon RE2 n=1 Tax=Vitis vinifera TaxID=29760 RepID=A0A438HCN8_VITVI|nr:Retrovirus-related Pol polyprotein from transposon RE2 [Vitis vinifera]
MAGDDEQPPLPPPKREMNSPFFLGTGDRPGDFITPTRLRGDNYDDWASDIQLALEARRKFEQWKALAGLIGNAQVPDDTLNGKFDTKSWIIDTGATHHVTGDLSWLFDTIALFECPVGLPNGESVVATQSSSLRLSNNITLKNDHTRELIGTGVRRDGLYYFGGAEGDSVQHVSVHNAASTLELWHKRMGHPSEKVVKLLPPDVFPFGNPGAENIIPDNIVPIVNVEIDSDFANFVMMMLIYLTHKPKHKNPNLIQPKPQAHQDLSPGPEVVPTVGLDSLGLDNTSNGQSAPMGKGMRDKFPSVLLRDFVTHTMVAESPSPTTPSPQHPSEAMKDVGWQKSMHEEIRALEENGTWTLEPLPKGKRALGSQWVYRTKYFSNGDIERLKSRLVVLGNHQEAGIDYHKTFSPVAKMTTVRAFLAIAASKNWELHKMDVHNAFLHGDLEEEVYMKLPQDLRVPIRTWFAVFPRNRGGQEFGWFVLCQRKYTLDIVSEAGLLGAKLCGLPIEQNHRLGLANGELLSNPESYRRLVGRLIYLAVTRPDLAYSVHILSQFMQEPRIEHWEAALRVVRYLKGTPGQGILLRADSDLSLQGWCDSDWAACPVTRRSLSGWLVFLGQSPISWKTKKQHTVSRSSAEVEYRAMAAVTCELKWLKGLLLSLGVHHPKQSSSFVIVNQPFIWPKIQYFMNAPNTLRLIVTLFGMR